MYYICINDVRAKICTRIINHLPRSQILQFTSLWVAIILVSSDPVPSRRNELIPIDDEHPWSNKHHSSSVHSMIGWLSALIYTLVTMLVITFKQRAKDGVPADTKLENTRDNNKALFIR